MARTFYGTNKDGKDVHAFILGNAGGLQATVLSLGGTITSIRVMARDGRERNVVLGLRDLAAYEARGSWNCIIGRFANRLKGGITIGGHHYELSPDANGVTLHGGRGHSWGARLWDVIEDSDNLLRLCLVSPDGDQGFPGKVTAEIAYEATQDSLKLDYTARTDGPTVINLTNHLYFNLAGFGSICQQTLELNADAITPTDMEQVPTGEIEAVQGTAFDFRTPIAIGTRVDADDPQMKRVGGLDHNFVLNKTSANALEWAARLRDPESGLTMEVLTTEPGIQVYSGNSVRPGQLNVHGVLMNKREGLALETQHFPDSPNKANFPSTNLNPGEIFRSTTVFRFQAI